MSVNRVAIVGAGPAGMMTALQLKRYGISPLLFESHETGGLLRNANLVENYPGFPGGIRGPQLVRRIKQQLEQAGVDVIHEAVLNIGMEGNTFLLETPRQTFLSSYTVIASGTKPRARTIPEPPSPQACALIYDEVAPLLHVKGKRIVIFGAGDAAFDYALNLSRANQVFILNRGTAVKCIPLLWERAQAVPAISYHAGIAIAQIIKAGAGAPANLQCLGCEDGRSYWADYVIFAIGREPQLDFLAENVRQRQLELIAGGLLYLVGDVNHGIYRQTAIAVGDGLLAAMKLSRLILGN
jgi:thioredoxin reductase (NADPH)